MRRSSTPSRFLTSPRHLSVYQGHMERMSLSSTVCYHPLSNNARLPSSLRHCILSTGFLFLEAFLEYRLMPKNCNGVVWCKAP
ncbi:hypothetical protein AN958_06032 [Leucoagaricus sp. SymC.cos]|nr:hypothetical protein AN958_06032 [Leucoagaricus sp. SymC.cos]